MRDKRTIATRNILTDTTLWLAPLRRDDIEREGFKATAAAPLAVTIYKPALATWYGPGFFGNLTACGIPLTPDLQGLAHRTLPCGTQVAITYGGRSIVLPVIDRGPFRKGYAWDLTKKAAKRVGFLAVGAARIQATVTPPPPPAA